MDKTLEIILVATTLIVASVIVISLLQGQSDGFGGFADEQTESASCGIGYEQWTNSIECDGGSGETTERTDELEDRYSDCDWASPSPNPNEACG